MYYTLYHGDIIQLMDEKYCIEFKDYAIRTPDSQELPTVSIHKFILHLLPWIHRTQCNLMYS